LEEGEEEVEEEYCMAIWVSMSAEEGRLVAASRKRAADNSQHTNEKRWETSLGLG